MRCKQVKMMKQYEEQVANEFRRGDKRILGSVVQTTDCDT